MTKPINAIELSVHADLSGHWLGKAIAQLHGYAEEIEWDDYCSIGILRIASQSMGVALPIVAEYKLYIEVDFEYQPDEWSYGLSRYNTEIEGIDEIIIWSPGT